MFAFNGYAWVGFDSKVGSPTFCVTISGANKLSIEVLAEYVWLDADGVTRSKTMTMTARWGGVGVRSGIQNPEQDSHHVSEHRVVRTRRSILC